MSLILDALRKLDREKSSRRNRTSNIAAEVVRPDELRPPRKILRPFTVLSLTAVLAAALTYAVVLKFDILPKLSPSLPADSPGPIQQVASPPSSGESAREVREEVKRTPPQIRDHPQREESAPAGARPAGQPQVASAPLSREPVREARGDVSQEPLEGKARAEREKPAGSGPVPASPPVEAKPPEQQVVPAAGSGEPAHKVPEEISQVRPKIQARAEREKPAGSGPVPASPPVEAKPQVASAPLPPGPQGGVSQEPAKIQERGESKIPAISQGENKAGRRVVPGRAEASGGSMQKPPPPTRRGSAISPTALKISGIVWSEERSERRAVINGVFTTEGSVIDGVKVEEIYPTRVRFSHEGRFFEVSVFE
jgi:hypothetical protein